MVGHLEETAMTCAITFLPRANLALGYKIPGVPPESIPRLWSLVHHPPIQFTLATAGRFELLSIQPVLC